MLRSMGWHLHRIWSIDWFRNPQEAIEAVLSSVARAKALGEPGAGVPAPQNELVVVPPVAEVARTTTPAKVPVRQFPQGEPYVVATPPHYAVRSRLLEWW